MLMPIGTLAPCLTPLSRATDAPGGFYLQLQLLRLSSFDPVYTARVIHSAPVFLLAIFSPRSRIVAIIASPFSLEGDRGVGLEIAAFIKDAIFGSCLPSNNAHLAMGEQNRFVWQLCTQTSAVHLRLESRS